MVKMLIETLFTILNMFSLFILIFSLFRIQIKGNDKQISILALTISFVNFYFKFVIDSPYFFLIQIVVMMVMLTMLRRYPLFYSFLVTCIGLFIASLLDFAVSIIAISLKMTTAEKMRGDLVHFSSMHMIMFLLYLLVSLVIVRKKWGFSFVIRRFSGKFVLGKSNYLWSIALIIGILALQLGTMSFNYNSLHFYILIILAFVLFVSLYYTYKQNQKVVAVRYPNKEERKI